MKETKNVSFSKATITEEDGEFKITEVGKEDSKTYNLTNQIRKWIGEDGLTVTIKKDNDIPSEE
jgi:hypothetical protein